MFIKRCLFEKLLPWLDSPHILIIKGARRAGEDHLIRILAAQVGSLLNKSELADTLKIRFETVSRYLDILEETFVLESLRVVITKDRLEKKKRSILYRPMSYPW